jgi:hypothetical protein
VSGRLIPRRIGTRRWSIADQAIGRPRFGWIQRNCSPGGRIRSILMPTKHDSNWGDSHELATLENETSNSPTSVLAAKCGGGRGAPDVAQCAPLRPGHQWRSLAGGPLLAADMGAPGETDTGTQLDLTVCPGPFDSGGIQACPRVFCALKPCPETGSMLGRTDVSRANHRCPALGMADFVA